MIYPIQYGATHVEKDKDGKDVHKQVPPKYALQIRGPVIQVTITQPIKVAQILIAQKKPVPSITVQALIDTGAFGCVIKDSLAQQLNLVQTGFQNVTSVTDQQKRPKFFTRILFPWGKGIDLSAASCPLKGVDCLIGRDVMVHWNLIYNGATGQITICD